MEGLLLQNFKKGMAENILPIYSGCELFVKTVKPQHIHALCLKLVAVKFVDITIPNERLIGTKKLNKSEMYVSLVKDDLKHQFRICDDSQWAHNNLNCRVGPG